MDEKQVTEVRPRRWFPSAAWFGHGPLLAQVVVTRRCNISCGYCNEFDKTSAPVPTAIVKQWIDKLKSFRTYAMEFTGGETLLHPDIVELVAHASRVGFGERWIITNGFLLTPAIVDRLNGAGLSHLQISLDGVEPTETTVKVLKTTRKKLDLLAERAKFVVQVNAVLGANQAEQAVEVARVAKELGFRPRISILHDGNGAMLFTPAIEKALRDAGEIMGRRWKESKDYRTRLAREGKADFRCRAGARYIYVDEFGQVNWCSQQRGVWSKALLDYTWKDISEQFYTQKTCAPACTVGCVRTASRLDEWRSQSRQPPPPPYRERG
jgi:MoaA/NifB/PqqE/SkfB family radical SAM enzyme